MYNGQKDINLLTVSYHQTLLGLHVEVNLDKRFMKHVSMVCTN